MNQSSIEERKKNMDKLNKLIKEFGYEDKVQYLVCGEFEKNFNIVKDYINNILNNA
jgi:hypothetical protein